MRNIRGFLSEGVDTHIQNHKKNTIDYWCWKKHNQRLAKIVEKNVRYKDCHKGDRCFIIANGPSINEQNLSLIKDEIIFGMNLSAKVLLDRGIRFQYYFALDGIFFAGNRQSRDDMIRNLEALKQMGGVHCFFPIEALDFILGQRFDLESIANFCGPIRLSLDKLDTSVINKCDLSRFRYMSYSIAIDAVMAAIYMGFKEIFLLGCDASVIKSRIDAFLGQDLSPVHFYENDTESFINYIEKTNILHELKTEYYCFSNWNYIRLYCKKHGIRLVNLSAETLLDFVDRMDYEACLKMNGIIKV